MTNIYNLFKFIQDKEKKQPKPDVAFKLKLTYAPEELTPEDLTVKGNLELKTGDTKLPDNLEVTGYFFLTTTSTALPKNLRVGSAFTLVAHNLKELPSNLHVDGTFNVRSDSLERLSDSLEVKELQLETEKITTLPKDLNANRIDISQAKNLTPSGIPENLRSRIKWNGGTFDDFATYMELPAIAVPGYSQDVKARKIKLKTIEDLPEFKKIDANLPELMNLLKKQPAGNFEVYNIYEPSYGGKVSASTQVSVKLPQLPAPLLLKYKTGYVSNGEIKYKNKTLKLYTFESDIANRGLDIALGRLVPGYAKQVVPKYLQDEKGKALRLSQIIDREQKPVSMDLGKKKRAGLGVKGQYKDYALAFSPDAQNTLINLGKRLGVEWKDFIAYRHNDVGDPNYVVKGEAPNGEVFYVNKFGSGQGSSTKVYDKNFSQV